MCKCFFWIRKYDWALTMEWTVWRRRFEKKDFTQLFHVRVSPLYKIFPPITAFISPNHAYLRGRLLSWSHSICKMSYRFLRQFFVTNDGKVGFWKEWSLRILAMLLQLLFCSSSPCYQHKEKSIELFFPLESWLWAYFYKKSDGPVHILMFCTNICWNNKHLDHDHHLVYVHKFVC